MRMWVLSLKPAVRLASSSCILYLTAVSLHFTNLVLTLVSSGPSKKPFSLKEKQLGEGEASQGIEDSPFQHSPLGKPIVRPATGSLLNKRWVHLPGNCSEEGQARAMGQVQRAAAFESLPSHG